MKTLRQDGLVLAALALTLLTSLYAWGRVADTLPVHWGLSGAPDRYGGRLEALGALPLVALALYGFSFILPRAVGGESNRKLVRSVLHIVLLSFAALHLALVAHYLGAEFSVTRLAGLVVGVVLIGTGNLLPKAQPNRWVGVRTPWTFKSRESWFRSQRLGGYVMALAGAAFIVTALVTDSSLALFALTGVTLLAVFGLIFYSYQVWRHDENPEPSL